MNNAEAIQVPAIALWNIDVGRFRHVSISDASADMVKDTAIALSKMYPRDQVTVKASGYIRWFFENGQEVKTFTEAEVLDLCPFSTSQYKRCWRDGQSFPVVKWVDQSKDGRIQFI